MEKEKKKEHVSKLYLQNQPILNKNIFGNSKIYTNDHNEMEVMLHVKQFLNSVCTKLNELDEKTGPSLKALSYHSEKLFQYLKLL